MLCVCHVTVCMCRKHGVLEATSSHVIHDSLPEEHKVLCLQPDVYCAVHDSHGVRHVYLV